MSRHRLSPYELDWTERWLHWQAKEEVTVRERRAYAQSIAGPVPRIARRDSHGGAALDADNRVILYVQLAGGCIVEYSRFET